MGELRSGDIQTVREQLGRDPTTPFTVVARCPSAHPLVIRNEPFDARGRPFPTTFWLTCPAAGRAVSRLESEGWIARLNGRAAGEPAFAGEVRAAHEEYARERAREDPDAAAFGGVGGTREGVKCLHAHYANHLAGGNDPVGRWVATRVEPIHPDERPGRVAAVDLGTNSIRLLVASRADDGSLDEFARDMVITRIGQGVDRSGRIHPDALARTVGVLARYARRARALHAERTRVTATSAVRDASNREELEAAVRSHVGEDLRVITGEQEAALTFAGGTAGLDAERPFAVLDIGGGSTEVVVGGDAPDAATSLQLGSVRMTERFVRDDPPSADELDTMREEIERILDEAAGAVPADRARTLVAVAGTPTTVQAMSLGLERYDRDAIHHTWLAIDDVEAVLGRLAAMTNAERAAIGVMPPGRGDVIVAGAQILVTAMRRFGFDRALVSETDILDGLAFELLAAR
jgi:exopolyphosphatase/guanosine-5'-triphosphate,3'-diphosphate pyrophosphatase